jgi:hypothetical protein
MHSNPMNRIAAAVSITAALVAFAPVAHAADFDFSGEIVMNNDLVNIDFTSSGGAVRLYTDSFGSGLNFDPQLTLWRQVGTDYVLVDHNDDDNSFSATQGYQDAGLGANLVAGSYKLTLSASSYQAVGTQLSQGFGFDPFFLPALTPTPIASWNQPSYDPDLNNQKGGAWSVHLTGDSVLGAAVSPVPEPRTLWLMLAGAAALLAFRGRNDRSSRADDRIG